MIAFPFFPDFAEIVRYHEEPPMQTAWQSVASLREKFAFVGENVRVSVHAVFVNPQHITLGSNTRIDAFCLVTAGEGGVEIGRYVHLATGSRVLGSGARIVLADGAYVGFGSTVFSASDDYLSGAPINPTWPAELRDVKAAPVIFEPFSGISTHCVVLPGLTLGFGAALGACSLATRSVPEGEIWIGSPAKKHGDRPLEALRAIEARLGRGEL